MLDRIVITMRNVKNYQTMISQLKNYEYNITYNDLLLIVFHKTIISNLPATKKESTSYQVIKMLIFVSNQITLIKKFFLEQQCKYSKKFAINF